MGLFDSPADEPSPVDVSGRTLSCLVCRNTTFHQRSAQLHGGMATFFNIEWASPTAVCVICSECGYIHWFLPRRE